MASKYRTVQTRHAHKWWDRIFDVKRYDLDNYFLGEPSTVEALKWSADKLGAHLRISYQGTDGDMKLHSNCWYEFRVHAA